MSRKKWPSEKVFQRLINNKSSKTYWDNISELRSRPTKEVFERALLLTHSKVKKERIIGIDILAQLGFEPRPFLKQTLKRYFEILENEKDADTIMSLLFAIGHNNEKLTGKQISKIVEFKNHKDIGVRQGVVSTLLSVENNKAITCLIELTNDKCTSIRDWATFGIGTQIEINNPKIIEALWNRVKDSNIETRHEAIVGLAIRNDERIKDIIINELKFGDCRTLIFEAINTLNDKIFLPYLKAELKTIKADENISEFWIQELKSCIKELKK